MGELLATIANLYLDAIAVKDGQVNAHSGSRGEVIL